MKLLSVLLLASGLALPAAASEITLYSHRHYEADDALFDAFTKRSGVRVNVVKAGADELIERLKAEGANTPADVLITADAGRLVRAEKEGLLQPVESKTLAARIPSALRDPEGHWFGFTKRARVIVYAKDRVKPSELSTYEDLADNRWRGRILVRSSANIYNQSLMASMIAEHGGQKAQEWARAVRRNMARPPQGSDRDQMRAVAAGLGDIAIANTYYLGLLVNSSEAADRAAAEKIAVFFPNQDGRGTHVNISGAGVTKASDNREAAVQFLEFLASDEAQAVFPTSTSEYPVATSVEWSDLQKQWGRFKEDSLNLSVLGELNEEAVRTFNRAGWE
ncbi:MAG TPA: Fe(3+) ABC transporter substrate-binding protein [Methylomirabilota bacterium]|nr:Fe(3+) ABC transporter substrate-binding protein [Methylomirabilota bacterium]